MTRIQLNRLGPESDIARNRNRAARAERLETTDSGTTSAKTQRAIIVAGSTEYTQNRLIEGMSRRRHAWAFFITRPRTPTFNQRTMPSG